MGFNLIRINFADFPAGANNQCFFLLTNICCINLKLEKYFNTHQKLFGSTITQDTLKKLPFPLINMEALLQGTEHNAKELEGWGNLV